MRPPAALRVFTVEFHAAWAIGAAGAQDPYKVKAAGSNPASPTIASTGARASGRFLQAGNGKGRMGADFISLAVIVVVAAVCPIIAQLVPSKLVPESVFLLIAGALLGPNLAGVIATTDTMDFLSDLGLAFLFLLAGMEIEPKNLVGHEGKRGIAVWGITFVIALLAMYFAPPLREARMEGLAVAIALTTTAFGTLVPIMKERGLQGTPVGDSIMAYGTWGELAPVLAITILLSTRAKAETLLVLAAFIAIAVVLATAPRRVRQRFGTRLFRFLREKANSTYQTTMRMTMLVLVLLVALSALFDLDIVLGAFAAGFVIRHIMPGGDTSLETKLDGAAYGFFIPLFFVMSGAQVNLLAIGESPLLLVGFIVALLLVRGVPIFVSLCTDRACTLPMHKRLTVAFYCTTALPLIVAVTSVAVDINVMSQNTASVLVAAGAITVFLMPLCASLTYHVADAEPVEAAKEIAQDPANIKAVLHEHKLIERRARLENRLEGLDRKARTLSYESPRIERKRRRMQRKLDRVIEQMEG